MNCQQVDKILYLLCDGRLQPHLSSQIEEHVKNCSSCRHNYLMTAMETEVLRDIGDIPRLSPDFCERVMLRVAEQSPQGSYASKTVRERLTGLCNLFDSRVAGGMLAVVVLLFLIVKWPFPAVLQTGQNTHSVKQPKTSSTPLKTEISAQDTQSSAAIPQPQPSTDEFVTGNTPGPYHTMPDYGRSMPGTHTNNRGSVSSVPADSPTFSSGNFTVVRPHYVPAGYSLVKVQSGVNGDLSLIYSDQTGSKVHVLIQPMGGEKETGSLGQSPNASFSGGGVDRETGVQTKALAGDSGEQTLVRNTEKENNPLSMVTRSLEVQGHSYRVEVSGSLPLEELARIADSCQ